MIALNIPGITVEESTERLKIVLPIRRSRVYLGTYSILLLVWIGMLLYGLMFTWQIALSGARFAFVFTLLLLVFLFVLYRLGRIIWRQWQFYVANREVLFLFKDHLIIRRPVSLLGITHAYDRQYMRPFTYDHAKHSPAFEYGSLYILFGGSLPGPDGEALVVFLNGRYFPHDDNEDERWDIKD